MNKATIFDPAGYPLPLLSTQLLSVEAFVLHYLNSRMARYAWSNIRYIATIAVNEAAMNYI